MYVRGEKIVFQNMRRLGDLFESYSLLGLEVVVKAENLGLFELHDVDLLELECLAEFLDLDSVAGVHLESVHFL